MVQDVSVHLHLNLVAFLSKNWHIFNSFDELLSTSCNLNGISNLQLRFGMKWTWKRREMQYSIVGKPCWGKEEGCFLALGSGSTGLLVCCLFCSTAASSNAPASKTWYLLLFSSSFSHILYFSLSLSLKEPVGRCRDAAHGALSKAHTANTAHFCGPFTFPRFRVGNWFKIA